jgi:hypothetical protein
MWISFVKSWVMEGLLCVDSFCDHSFSIGEMIFVNKDCCTSINAIISCKIMLLKDKVANDETNVERRWSNIVIVNIFYWYKKERRSFYFTIRNHIHSSGYLWRSDTIQPCPARPCPVCSCSCLVSCPCPCPVHVQFSPVLKIA